MDKYTQRVMMICLVLKPIKVIKMNGYSYTYYV